MAAAPTGWPWGCPSSRGAKPRPDQELGLTDVVGIGGTLGWEHTFRFGLSLRIGGGAAYEVALRQDAGASFAVTGVRPLLDGDVGWVF